jgi:rhamnogalacturonyl hydrolase YesR
LAACAVLLAAACGAPTGDPTAAQPTAVSNAPEPGRYAAAAIDAATWIRSTAVTTEHGAAWPADPYDTASVATSLYTGTPGVVLFFLELAGYAGDAGYLNDARAGADFLLARLEGGGQRVNGETGEPVPDGTMQNAGLYTGLAGIGFVLHETYRATGDTRYRDGARRAVALIHEQARETGSGVDWIESTDIISGSAGTGLFLIWAADRMDDPASIELAKRAGYRLIEVAERHDTGLGWRVNPEYPRLMPNFSHGTAGVAYFLADLYEGTGEQAFLDAAVAGGERLLALAETEGDICLVFHHTDGGEELQYLSWCHGPAGTARTFYKLWQVTGDQRWLEWTGKAANGVYASGIPETLTEGFWNNVGQCCGSAGVAEFAMALHGAGVELPASTQRATTGGGDGASSGAAAQAGGASATATSPHLAFARRTADNLLARATQDAGGLMWIQAEHRVQPDFLVAQTGYMQGAAGIGMMLLHLDALIEGRPSPRIVFPDAPY